MKNHTFRKALSLLLCLVLVMGIIPVAALATDEPGAETIPMTVYVNGVDVKDIDAEDDTISWDETTNTLTLNNASILNENGNYKGSGIYAVGSDTLVLELVGDNTVEGKFNGTVPGLYRPVPADDIFANAAISTVGDLVIRGEGSLTATDLEYIAEGNAMAPRSAGIYSGGQLSVEGGSITATSYTPCDRYIGSSGIISGDFDSMGIMSISGGTVIASGLDAGITSVSELNITGGNVVATSTHGFAVNLYTDSDIGNALPRAAFSGGRVELQGADGALAGYISCDNYDGYMWTDTKDGTPQYSAMPNIMGYFIDYLLIEPANYRPAQPTAENRYTVGLETLADGEFTAALPEGVTAEYQWYAPTSQDVTAQDVMMSQDCTYDEATGLWSFTSYGSLVLAAQPGQTVTLTLSEAPYGLFVVATYTGENFFSAVSDTVYSHTVTEQDLDPDTGLLGILVISEPLEEAVECSVSLTTYREVTTAAGEANRFSSDTAGTYFARVTFAENGTVLGTLSTKSFDYLPVNTVTFDANGGSCDTVTAQAQEGSHTLASLPEATQTGYSFQGWFDAEGNQITTDTVISEDITVYARWAINSYTLTVQGVEGTLYEAPVVYGSDLNAIVSGLEIGEIVTENGTYTFTGSFDVEVPATMPAADLTLTAQYTFTPKCELVYENGAWYYYENGKLTYGGLIRLDGSYYYIRSNGQAVTNQTFWITKTNDLLPAAAYYFDETGKLIEKNGLIEENGGLYYYENSQLNYAGLIQVDGAYYYIRSNGQAVTGKVFWITKTNGLLPATGYTFGADGKMIEQEKQNGFVHENDGIYYYVDGQRNYGGLILVDGNYYYVRSTGQVVTGKVFWITKTNDLLPAAGYQFDDNGVMVNAPV